MKTAASPSKLFIIGPEQNPEDIALVYNRFPDALFVGDGERSVFMGEIQEAVSKLEGAQPEIIIIAHGSVSKRKHHLQLDNSGKGTTTSKVFSAINNAATAANLPPLTVPVLSCHAGMVAQKNAKLLRENDVVMAFSGDNPSATILGIRDIIEAPNLFEAFAVPSAQNKTLAIYRDSKIEHHTSRAADIRLSDKDLGKALKTTYDDAKQAVSLMVSAIALPASTLPTKEQLDAYRVESCFAAIASNDVAVIQDYLAAGNSANAVLPYSSISLLFAAVSEERKEIVTLLLKNKADVNLASNGGDTPLQEASRQGNKEIVGILLNSKLNPKADTNKANDEGITPLHYAALNGHLEVAGKLLKRGAKASLHKQSNDGSTPLLAASSKGYTKLAELLIGEGADVNVRQENGATPILLAAANGHLETVKLLSDAGADLDIGRAGDGFTPLTIATARGDKEMMRALLFAGATPNKKLPDGRTALMIAQENNDEAAISLLQKRGAHSEKSDSTKKKPSFINAVKNGDIAAARLRLSEGEDPSKARDGIAPIIWAAINEDIPMVILLEAYGANLNAVDPNTGATALLWAAEKANNRLLNTLAELGADVNKGRHDGTTPLHFAAINGKPRMVDTLTTHKANLNPTRTDNLTPLYWSVNSQDVETSRKLWTAGADATIAWKGYTAIGIAPSKSTEINNILHTAPKELQKTQAAAESLALRDAVCLPLQENIFQDTAPSFALAEKQPYRVYANANNGAMELGQVLEHGINYALKALGGNSKMAALVSVTSGALLLAAGQKELALPLIMLPLLQQRTPTWGERVQNRGNSTQAGLTVAF